MRKISIVILGLLLPLSFVSADTAPVKHIFANGIEVGVVNGTGSDAVVHYMHTDSLTGSNVVTNNVGTIDEILDYYPFGKTRMDSGSYSDQRKYIGQEYDNDTGFDYLNARYYNPGVGQFLSQDPEFWSPQSNNKLFDPQSLNSYSYGANNPINKSDPTGLLVVIIPGTKFGGGGTQFYNPNLIENINKSFPNQNSVVYNWDGGDNSKARNQAAISLPGFINGQFQSLPKNEPLNFVCHSHGCNVTAAYTQGNNAKQINNLLSFGMPVRNDYSFDENKIRNHVNIYSNKDGIQTFGGGQFSVTGTLGWILCRAVCGILGGKLGWGEFGPAQRQVSGADYNVNVTGLTKGDITSSHSELWRSNSIWESISNKIKP